MRKRIELQEGQRFGRLTVIKELPFKVSDKGVINRYFLFRCDCGSEISVSFNSARTGNTQSCGCLQMERTSNATTKHGLYGTRVYREWFSVKERCYNKNYKDYVYYGGRGIVMYDEWINSPLLFGNYCMTLEGWDNNSLSLDRINNDGNYEPGNLRFATKTTQARNQRLRKNNKTGYTGVFRFTLSNGDERFIAKINNKYLGLFKTIQEAHLTRCRYIIENNIEGYNISEKTFEQLVSDNK